MKLLIVSTCREKLHELEFVKPVENIVKDNCEYEIKNYREVKEEFIDKFDKIIICGTSLQDNDFLGNIDKFNWLRGYNGAILGICAGMQVLGLVFGGKMMKKLEVGYYFENFEKDFLGMKNKQEVWHLHNSYVDFSEDFENFTDSDICQAVKHKEKGFYGVLFHPEVRNKGVIKEFIFQ